jgi:hypothetical protein
MCTIDINRPASSLLVQLSISTKQSFTQYFGHHFQIDIVSLIRLLPLGVIAS